MMYSEIDLQCEDLLWFGVDRARRIFSCTTAGQGNVPLFVCRSREETELLADYFLEQLPESTEENLLIDRRDTLQAEAAVRLSRKGVCCYDLLDVRDPAKGYRLIAFPSAAITLDRLPEQIRRVLSDHVVDADVSAEIVIRVPHAY